MSDDILDVGAINRAAELALSNSEYRHKYERADFYTPNKFQTSLRGAVQDHRFVLGRAGGQIGKSTAAMAYVNECLKAGKHPGRAAPKLDRPYKFVVWILSETGQTTILGPQTRLIGAYPDAVGTGLLSLRNIKRCIGAHGVPGLISEAICETDQGDPTIIRFRQYQQGKAALTSEGVDLVVCDELPPDKALWAELMQRVSATNGTILTVATPGKQANDILYWFDEPGPSKLIVPGSVDDADHMSAEQKKELAAHYKSISEAEYRSRYLGLPFVGGGRVFSFDPASVYLDDNDHMSMMTEYVLGLDAGHGGLSDSAHPTAVVCVAFDRQTKDIKVMRTFCQNKLLPRDVWAAVRDWPESGAPCAWGAAERQGVAGSRQSYIDLFKREGFNTMHDHATHADGGVDLETSITQAQDLIRIGKLKFHRRCGDLVNEMLNLERDEDGKLISFRDDRWSALRYALMCLKRARYLEGSIGASRRSENKIAKGVNDNSWDIFTGQPN